MSIYHFILDFVLQCPVRCRWSRMCHWHMRRWRTIHCENVLANDSCKRNPLSTLKEMTKIHGEEQIRIRRRMRQHMRSSRRRSEVGQQHLCCREDVQTKRMPSMIASEAREEEENRTAPPAANDRCAQACHGIRNSKGWRTIEWENCAHGQFSIKHLFHSQQSIACLFTDQPMFTRSNPLGRQCTATISPIDDQQRHGGGRAHQQRRQEQHQKRRKSSPSSSLSTLASDCIAWEEDE